MVHGKVVLSGHTIQATIGTTMSHTIFLSGNFDGGNSEAGKISFPNGTLGGQALPGLNEISLREEFAKMNEIRGSIIIPQKFKPGSQTRRLLML
jgi:hypothetical protein